MIKKYLLLFLAIFIFKNVSFSQSFTLQKGSDLTYLVYGDSQAVNLHVFIEEVSPDFKFAWILNCKNPKYNDTGLVVMNSNNIESASALMMNFNSKVKPKKGACSLLLSKTLFSEIRKDSGSAGASADAVQIAINSKKKVTMGNCSFEQADVTVNFNDFLLPALKITEVTDENGNKVSEETGAIITTLDNTAYPLIAFFQTPDGNHQYVLVSVNNAIIKVK